jgi:geranylgeranyl diphosphate synthase type II
MDVDAYLSSQAISVEKFLDQRIPKASAKPATIHKAMRYSLFAGGKRLRPAACIAAAEACGGTATDALPAAAAVECIHTYSLIHDDLPCMDDDDLRRGRPTNHKVFGEGIAVLAGDALLTVAFEIIASHPGSKRHPTATLVRELATASGSTQLIAGQVLDLEHEGKPISPATLRFIHSAKTAALLTASLRLGAMCANATPTQMEALTQFGSCLGLAFQVIDDILDVTQSTEKLGKTAGKDLKAVKATYPALFGLEKSRRTAADLTRRALTALDGFKRKGDTLRSLANRLLVREY